MNKMDIAAGTTVGSNSLLRRIAQTVGELPASPSIVSAVMGLTSNLNSDIEKLSKVLSADTALTAKVLRLSNSSFYGRSKSVSTLREAILILGFYTLRSLVVASSTHSLYRKKGQKSDQRLWEHSLACAMASRLVASRIGHPAVEEIFIAGLLHDIGKLILSERLGNQYAEIIRSVELGRGSFHELEKEQLGFNHADIGSVILSRWNFPAQLVEGVLFHHIETMNVFVGKHPPISAVVHYSNFLAKKIDVGYSDHCESDLATLPLAEQNRFTEATVEEFINDLRTHYNEEKFLFEEN